MCYVLGYDCHFLVNDDRKPLHDSMHIPNNSNIGNEKLSQEKTLALAGSIPELSNSRSAKKTEIPIVKKFRIYFLLLFITKSSMSYDLKHNVLVFMLCAVCKA
jgi:hypothetical protein